ncbi:hypothetical protein DVH24_036180 [Malus domestica]|uniref:Uncharacterized protein n=1 Tax=Malus domestica TaxID=3750 RepID=A0A498IFN2_MALDO|nr:hypothetical protein DVH24_036180 [Malus domestica]
MGVRLADIHLSQTLRKAGALCTGYDLLYVHLAKAVEAICVTIMQFAFGLILHNSTTSMMNLAESRMSRKVEFCCKRVSDLTSRDQAITLQTRVSLINIKGGWLGN